MHWKKIYCQSWTFGFAYNNHAKYERDVQNVKAKFQKHVLIGGAL